MALEIVAFTEEHIGAAVALSMLEARRLIEVEPALPPMWLDRDERANQLQASISRGLGVAALGAGELVGFLVATLDLGGAVPEAGWPSRASLGGGRSAEVPIGAHAAAAAPAYRQMFAVLAQALVDRGCLRHSIALVASDKEAVRTWFELGFGVDQILGTRDLAPLLTPPNRQILVRKAEAEDIDPVLKLNVELQRYHADLPIFLPFLFAEGPVRSDLLKAMQDEGRAIWVAERAGQILGMMEVSGIRRSSLNSARTNASITIGTASVAEEARGQGVGQSILSGIFEWGRNEGLDRCTVGWTSANLLSDAFWRRCGFRPVHFTLTRQLDERVATQQD